MIFSWGAMRFRIAALALLVAFSITLPAQKRANGHKEWRVFGGGFDNIHYSTLSQINRTNVGKLAVAWTYDTGDAFKGSEMQCNPIIIGRMLYATTPKGRVIALDAASGALRWSFNPFEGQETRGGVRNRGVTYWSGGGEERIFFVARHTLYALDAGTGKPAESFGDRGRVDIREGLGREAETLYVTGTTPGVIYKDLLILPTLVPESLPSAPGDIRAYDVRSGKIRWSFHTIPHPGEFGYETWPKEAWTYSGGANNWSGMAVDVERGLVFAPTGSASYDFYGANRHGDNLFANTLLALKADTGERVWHFQAIRHDVWDRDFPAAPTLVTLRRDGKRVDAVAQITKSGHVFVFDRATGKPLFPIEMRAAPPSPVDGEKLASMQPLPVKPPAFARQELTEDMLTRRTPEAHKIAVERFRTIRSHGQFEPPSFEGSIVFPGFDGGGEWGGAAFDPESGLLYVNANEMPWILRLVPKLKTPGAATGRNLYIRHCAGCHRDDLAGSPPQFPALTALAGKLSEEQAGQIIRGGNGRMPGFAHLGDSAVRAVTRYVLRKEDTGAVVENAGTSPTDLKYTTDGYNKFLDPDGYPAIEPPWGTLNAIDLNRGEIAWKIPFGEFPELAAKGMENTGTENYGGGVVTSGGLLFIGATNHDRKFHVYDKATGKLLWETLLPAAGNATPATYEVDGRQFVVIAAGGGKSGAPSGGSYVAFALGK